MIVTVIIDAAVRGVVLAVVVWIVLRSLRISSPRLEAMLWKLVLIAAFAMPLLMMSMRAFLPTATESATAFRMELVGAGGGSIHSTVLLASYWIVAAVLLSRQLLGLARGYAVVRRAVPHDDPAVLGLDVRVSDEISAPATFAGTVVLPRVAVGWDADRLDAVLAHERTHVRNHDFQVQLLAKLYRAAFWFSPLAWWLPRHLALTAEHVCDDVAVEATDRAAYAALLLDLARTPQRFRGGLAMARGMISERIERILTATGPATDLHPLRHVLAITALTPMLIGAAGASVVQFDLRVPPKSNRLAPLSAPDYPPAARRLSEHGTVILDLYVLPNGAVADVKVQRSSGFAALDASAAAAARHWRLDPGTLNGDPTASWGSVAVTFKLTD